MSGNSAGEASVGVLETTDRAVAPKKLRVSPTGRCNVDRPGRTGQIHRFNSHLHISVSLQGLFLSLLLGDAFCSSNSSSESLASSSDKYSLTVSQPPSELSARRISFILLWRAFFAAFNLFTAASFFSSRSDSSAAVTKSRISDAYWNWIWFPFFFKETGAMPRVSLTLTARESNFCRCSV